MKHYIAKSKLETLKIDNSKIIRIDRVENWHPEKISSEFLPQKKINSLFFMNAVR